METLGNLGPDDGSIDDHMLTGLVTGLLLGSAAGLAPGPLMTVVIAQSLKHGPREGCKVALAPLITDGPIIATAFLVAGHLEHAQPLLGLLSLAGGLFVLYLAAQTFLAPPPTLENPGPVTGSWLKGVLVNVLSPHPWMFWLTVGVVTLTRTSSRGYGEATVFLGTFYLFLVGTKIGLAVLIGRSRHRFNPRTHQLILRGLALALAVFACLLLHEGWTLTTALPGGNS